MVSQGLAQREELRGPFGGDVRSVAVHPARPDVFFLGTADGQLYTSSDRGSSWSRLRPGLNRRDLVVDNLVFHPDDPSILYAACWELNSSRGRLFVTRDSGSVWEELTLGAFNSQIRAMAVAASDPSVMAVGVAEGVLLSTDSGLHWERITRGYKSLHNVESMAFDPEDSHTLYVGTWRLGWKTRDRGGSWEPIHKGMHFDSDMFALLVNPREPDVLFASACTGVYRSGNAGSTWEKLRSGLPSEAKRTRTLQFDPSDPRVVLAGTTVGLYRTQDGGDSWHRLIADRVVNAVALAGDGGPLVVATDDAGILRSVDGGVSFQPSNTGFVHRQIQTLATHPLHPERVFAAVIDDGHLGGMFESDDGGDNWTQSNQGLSTQKPSRGLIRLIPGASGDTLLAVFKDQIRRLDGDGIWSRIAFRKPLTIHDAVLGRDGEQVVLATQSGVWIVDLKAGTISSRPIDVYQGAVWSVLFDASIGSLFASGDNAVFRSDDGGRSWTIKVNGLPPLAVTALAGRAKTLVAGTRKGIYLSPDSGNSWVRANAMQVPIQEVVVSPASPDWMVAVDATGNFLLESVDAGRNWTTHPPHRTARIGSLAFSTGGDLLAGSLTEGVYRITPPLDLE